MMKRTLLSLFAPLVLSLSALAWAQTLDEEAVGGAVDRLVVLAFDAGDAASPYRLGLATGLQRSLNVIGGVYAPPVGDTLLVAQRAEARGELSTETFAEAFGARALVSGLVSTSEGAVVVELIFAGPSYAQTQRVTVEGSAGDPTALLESVVTAVIAELDLPLSAEDEAQVAAVVAQTPSLDSLAAVGEASLGLEARDTPALREAEARDADSSWVLSERAEALAAQGELEAALAGSLAAIQAAPEDVEALVKRGVVLVAAGDRETARQAFEAALALNPAHAVALAGSARFAENAEAARAALERALASYPRYAAAYLELAALQREAGGAEGGLATLREAATRIPESASLQAAFIGEAVRSGDAAGALEFLEARLADDPDPLPSLYALATGLDPAQNARALEIVREGRERYPQDPALALAEAEVLREGGDLEGAEAVLSAARETAPENPELANQLAITQAQGGRTDEARATLEAAAAQTPQAREVLERNLAQLYLEAGQNEAALGTLEPLLERAPDDPDLYTLYGVALSGLGRFDQALSALDEALRRAPDDEGVQNARQLVEQNRRLTGGERLAFDPNVAAVFGAGLSAAQAGDLGVAQREFDRAFELQEEAAAEGPEAGTLAFYQGYARQLQGDLRGAVERYEAALTGLPESATVLNNAGFAYFRLGRLDRALDYLNRATRADPGNSEAQLNLGLVLYDLGRFERALEPLERALEANPELSELRVDPGDGEALPLPELVERARQNAE